MDRSIFAHPARLGHFVAASVAVVAIFVVLAAAVVCIGQALSLPLLTQDVTWLVFDTA